MAAPKKLGEQLVELGLINAEQLSQALEHQYATGHKLGTCLITLGFIQEPDLVSALTSKTEIKSLVIGNLDVPTAVRAMIPAKKAIQWEVIPLSTKTENGRKYLVLGMTDPTREDIVREVQFLTNHTVIPFFVGLQDLQAAYQRIYQERLNILKLPNSKPGHESAPEIELGEHPGVEEFEIVNPSTMSSGRELRRKPVGVPLGRLPENDSYEKPAQYEISEVTARLDRLERKLDEVLELLKS